MTAPPARRSWLALGAIFAAAALVLWFGRPGLGTDAPAGPAASTRPEGATSDVRVDLTGAVVTDRLNELALRNYPDLPAGADGRGLPGLVFEGALLTLGGAPVAGADLHLFEDLGPSGAGLRTLETQTGDDGQFTFEALAPGGTHRLEARHPDYAPLTLEGIRGVARERSEPRVLWMLPTAGVAGRVLDAEGRPIVGATIEVILADRPTEDSTPPTWRARTDGDGRFRVAGLPRAPVAVFAHAAGHASAGVDSVQPGGPESYAVELVLEGASRIAGSVVDEHNRPVGGVRVEAFRQGLGALVHRARATTDGSGRFEVEAPASGRVHLSTQAFGYAETRQGPLAAGRDDVRIVLEEALAVEGRVLAGTSSDGVPAAHVRLLRFDASERDDGGQLLEGPGVLSDAEGRFTIPCRWPGPYWVEARGAGTATGRSLLVRVEQGARAVADVRVHAGGSLQGRVVDDDGRPLAGARVEALRLQVARGPGAAPGVTEALGFSDTDGAFRVAHLAPAEYRLEVRAPGRAPAVRNFVVPGDFAPADVGDVLLSPGAAISGATRDLSGGPVAGARVQLLPLGARAGLSAPRFALTGPGGHFRFDGLPAGRFMVTAERSLRGAGVDLIDAARGDELVVELVTGDVVEDAVIRLRETR